MTKQQPSAMRLLPTRLCRLLFLAFFVKLSILGSMLIDSELMLSMLGTSPRGNVSVAIAADGESAGAPPSLPVAVPDVGMAPRSNGGIDTGTALPNIAPGVTTAPQTTPPTAPPAGGDANAAWSLPSIPTQGQAVSTQGGAAAGQPAATGQMDPLMRESMVRKQEELARKEQELRSLEIELSDKLEKMQLLENRLAIMMKDAEETKDAKFRHLVDVLSNMKAKSAAQVLETLDRRIAVRVLAGMRGRQAGEILTFVKPEIAASLTEALTRMQMPLE